MEFDNTDTARALAQMPLEPAKPAQPERSAWGAPWRAVKAAAAETLGTVADVVKGYGAAGAIVAEADPVARAALGAERIKAGADEGRAILASDEAMTSDIGTSFRNVAESLRPDPATASTAEKVVFGAVRPLAKLGLGAAFGPIGIGFASAEEGVTQADELRRQGVDMPTRTAVGAVTAGFTAASAYLPASGQTIKSTAALYLAGGPGGFVAQQALTRQILERADYGQIAQQYDPLDPMGLAVSSLVPLPFAVWGAARAMRAGSPDVATPAVQPETVDAAMAHNLTALADEVDARPLPAQDGAVAPDAPAARPADMEPDLPAYKPPEAADMDAVRQRLAALEEADPAARSEMEAVRKQIAEGADDELGTMDADLVRVAAECALSLTA